MIRCSGHNAQPVAEKGIVSVGLLRARSDFGRVGRARLPFLAIGWIVFGALSGCSGQSTFLTGGPSVGQLKTSLSHLELENEQLKQKVAKLERESRNLEDRLVQEQIDNGDLAARLDDARNLLRDRGVDADTRLGSHRSEGRSQRYASDEDDTGSHTLPAAQSSRKRRKPPFAKIPARVDDLPSSHDDDSPGSADGDRTSQSGSRRKRLGDDLDRRTARTSQRRWLPVAASNDDGLSLVR